MTNQHIFITGGASGIGAAAVRLFSNRGWNRITTTITTMILMLFCFGINIFAQSENVVPSGYPELDEWVKQCKVERPNALGYPGNYDSKLDSFYDWYTQNKMENILINNAGDPFGNPSTLSSLKFEREVIESFAPLYGFDLDNLWVE